MTNITDHEFEEALSQIIDGLRYRDLITIPAVRRALASEYYAEVIKLAREIRDGKA